MADLKSSERGTDLLGEALALAEVMPVDGDTPAGEAILAAARNWQTLTEPGVIVIRRELDPEFGDEWVWPEWAVDAASRACRRDMDGRTERHAASDLRAVSMLDALAASPNKATQ